ncbi:MAG: T9SS type A sorting domain-containing protein [Candidatus Competibacteraceae bacterium]|nr:T9SS type A sorting domain-containing protein [Candidatus Competibacteraceae bacterium]
MKKVLSIAFVALMGLVASAQSTFWEYTNYIGAFAPTPTARWTDGWCNFDPQNATYPTSTINVTANITTNTTWTSSNVYHLNDAVIYVKPGATLTIQPGTIIRGSGKGTLVIERGGKINAQGTASQPIVFTSNFTPGNRDYGDWGGVVICGAARHNLAAGPDAVVEGGIGDAATQTGVHGGTNDDDSSGVFSYVRIEFCGISLTPNPNSEINGLSMYSVGRKTKMDHIQVSYSGDDSFEWFGGTVDLKYIVAFHGWDDDFDTDNGYRGRVQFACSIRDSRNADQSGSNGFECDNDANGSDRTPKTNPTFSNVTIIGPDYTGNPDITHADYRRALHIRRNAATSVYNSIFTGYPSAGFLLDGRKTTANYCGDTLEFKANIIAGCANDWHLSNADTLCITGTSDFVTRGMLTNDTLSVSNDINLIDPFGNSNSNPDLRPASGSPALTVGSYFGFTTDFLSTKDLTSIQQASIYPNPASNLTMVSFNLSASADVQIYILDLNGKMLQQNIIQANAGSNMIPLQINTLANGVYVVQIINGKNQMVQKLIVQ